MAKEEFIIIRVDKNLKDKLLELAGGARKLSKFIRTILEKNTTKTKE